MCHRIAKVFLHYYSFDKLESLTLNITRADQGVNDDQELPSLSTSFKALPFAIHVQPDCLILGISSEIYLYALATQPIPVCISAFIKFC